METAAKLYNYRVAVKHDNGVVRILTNAFSASEAVDKIMKAEGWPKHSIISVSSI